MEDLKKSQLELLEEKVENLQKENQQLKRDKEMYEAWWRAADAKSLELMEAMKSSGTIANIIYASAKS